MGVQKNIAVLYGDGIGPEIMAEGIKVLDAVARKHGHVFSYSRALFGGEAYDAYGHPFPDETKQICDVSNAILKGPIGGPKYDAIPDEILRPEAGALLPLRKRYDTFANFRPVRMHPALIGSSSLKPEVLGDGVNIMMIRELTGGIYFGEKVENGVNGQGVRYARDVCEYTEPQVERIARVAFAEAQRNGQPLVNVHKKNVLATSRFWNKIVERIHSDEFPDVELQSQLVDSVAFDLQKGPRKYHNTVMLLENMMGDILTDQAGGILGSLGLMPTACVGTEKAYYEPAHGSAPSIAGKGEANPYAMIGSAAFMLDKSFGLKEESEEIWGALFGVFGAGYRTAELATGSTPKNMVVTTSQFGDLVAERI